MNIIIDKPEFYMGLVVGMALMIAFIKLKERQLQEQKA